MLCVSEIHSAVRSRVEQTHNIYTSPKHISRSNIHRLICLIYQAVLKLTYNPFPIYYLSIPALGTG